MGTLAYEAFCGTRKNSLIGFLPLPSCCDTNMKFVLQRSKDMEKKGIGKRITAFLLLLCLFQNGASYLLDKGGSYMKKEVWASGAPAAKPPIDLNVPRRTETATFALG